MLVLSLMVGELNRGPFQWNTPGDEKFRELRSIQGKKPVKYLLTSIHQIPTHKVWYYAAVRKSGGEYPAMHFV